MQVSGVGRRLPSSELGPQDCVGHGGVGPRVSCQIWEGHWEAILAPKNVLDMICHPLQKHPESLGKREPRKGRSGQTSPSMRHTAQNGPLASLRA